MGKIGDLWVRLGLKKDEFTAGLDEAKKETQSFGKDIKSAVSSIVGRTVALTAAFAAVGKAIAGAVKNMAQFERANSELAAVLGTNLKGVKQLSDSAKDLGRTSEFTASEVTQLQIALARLGFNTGQIEAMQGSILKFALAMGTDLGSAAEFTGSALRAFGLNASDTTALLDVMSKSTTLSALNFSKLQTSIGTVAPIAKSFGLDVKETAAFLGVLANNGFDASSAATALRNILLNLADSNGKLSKGLGHTAKTFPEIIAAFKELRDKGVDVNSVLQMTDKRSAAAAAALIAMAGDVDSLKRSLDDADGSLNTMADTMADNLIGQVNSLKSAWEGLTLEFGNSVGPMSKVIGKLRDLLNLLRDYQHASSTGGATRRDMKVVEDMRQRFLDIEKQFGTEEMERQFTQWERDAEAAYDRAIDNYNAHKTAKNKRAMQKAGRDVMALADIRSEVMKTSAAYAETEESPATSTTGGNGGGFDIPDPDAADKAKKKWKEYLDKTLSEVKRTVADELDKAVIKVPTPEVETPAPIEVPAPEVEAPAPVEVPAQEVSVAPVDVPAPEVTVAPVEVPAPEVITEPVEIPALDVKEAEQQTDKLAQLWERLAAAAPGPDEAREAWEKYQQAIKDAAGEISAEEAEIRKADEELAAAGDEAYNKWREIQGFGPPKLWDDDLNRYLEKGLAIAEQIGNEINADSLYDSLNKQLDEFIQKTVKARQSSEELAKAISENLVSALEDGAVGAFEALADVMGGVTEGGMEQVVKALLDPLAEMAIKAGTLIMMSGTAIEALKESLTNFFGGSAVVAGAALVAVGIAAKAGLAAIGNRGSAGTGVTSMSSSGSPYGGGNGVQTAELTVYVEGTVHGSDIILSGQNTLNSWNR